MNLQCVKSLKQKKRSDTMYTVTEVAKKFSVSRQTVLKWINNGKIKAVKVVKVYRIPKEEIDWLIDNQRKEDGNVFDERRSN